MARPRSGKWNGWLVCADRLIQVKVALDVSGDGTLHGEFTVEDQAYTKESNGGSFTGSWADNLTTLELSGGHDVTASFHGEAHPTLEDSDHRQVMFGYVEIHRKHAHESGVLALFSEGVGALRAGWNG